MKENSGKTTWIVVGIIAILAIIGAGYGFNAATSNSANQAAPAGANTQSVAGQDTPEIVQEAVVETPQLAAAPYFETQTSDGRTTELNENGKPTVVYFMASWCSSCAKNWDALNAVYPDYEDKVNFIAISVDPTDDAATLQELAAEKGFVFETAPGNPELALEYEVKKQTAKFAIDADGNIVSRHDGVLSQDEWRAMFESLINNEEVEQEAVVENTQLAAAPYFEKQTSEGRTVELNENGKPTVVYFMASWCGSCAKNWNALNEVYPDYQDEVNFVAISVDPTDDAATLQELAAEKGFVFETIPGSPELALEYDVRKQTAKFAIDADGNIVSRHDGVLSPDEWRDMFESLL